MSIFGNTPDFLLIVVGILVIIAAILILVAGRRDDDVGGTRTQTRYVGTITILTLFVTLLAFYSVVRALTQFIVDGHDDNSLYRDALDNGLLMIAAGIVFVFHYRRSEALAPAGKLACGATGAVARAAHYGICFVAAVLALTAAAKAVYGIFQIIAPGVFGGSGSALPGGFDVPPALEAIVGESGFEVGGVDGDVARQQGIADLLSYGSLALASVVIFLRSWNAVPENR
ncbi:MAG: hypothetical protein FJW86_07860 [Actinobacteria bacterium]|nr:hypothetical protein [Actinomycetota bacterium]